MMAPIPLPVGLLFIGLALLTLVWFCWIVKNSNLPNGNSTMGKVGVGMALWLVIQAVLMRMEIYSASPESIPPKIFLFGIFPAFALMILLLAMAAGRRFMDSLSLSALTYFHAIRIPVEIGLFLLAGHQLIPDLMTFEGRNFDILAGITAPVVAYFGIQKGLWSRSVLLLWYILSLLLLLNIIVTATLSTPSPFQQFAFDQPNIGILHFPVGWLPTFIVPVVLFAHVVAIRQLWNRKDF